MKLKFYCILFIGLLFNSAFAQSKFDIHKRKENENFPPSYLPHELKYGGVWQNGNYFNELYISYYLIGIMTKQSSGKRQHISLGTSYTRGLGSNFISIFPYYGNTTWFKAHCGVKVEPLINLNPMNLEYVNLELTFGMNVSVSLNYAVSVNQHLNSNFFGFKIGVGLPHPLVLFGKKRKPENEPNVIIIDTDKSEE